MGTGDVPGHDKAMGHEAEGRMWLGLDVKVLLGVPGCFSAEPCLWTSSLVSETHVGGPGDSSLPQDILDLDCSGISWVIPVFLEALSIAPFPRCSPHVVCLPSYFKDFLVWESLTFLPSNASIQ